MNTRSAKIYKVIENDRMYGKRRIIAAHVDLETATRIQSIGYTIADSWLQFSVNTESQKEVR